MHGPLSVEHNYFGLASPNPSKFPNAKTNSWLDRINAQMNSLFTGLQVFVNRTFVRDLVPYHSGSFGYVNMTTCTNYMYKYFFNQVIAASFHSELYDRINHDNSKPATIIFARGAAWNHKLALQSIGWRLIGRIYCNCTIYKADFDKIKNFDAFNVEKYSDHDIYIVVLTQAKRGAKLGVYVNRSAPLIPVNLLTVINNYYEINDVSDKQYIDHNPELDIFLKKLCSD